ncbi:PDR/VanB family oxidoreductase [Pseudonocardia petroleophila]|uniref:Oxidoreductase n=1 Tax=Pseudonocardia petroleophila TaxID=37331 RepID=A0A7G7MSF6_9PSEU|nr:oxidoreductase [Pseudonocardia petroleophila]
MTNHSADPEQTLVVTDRRAAADGVVSLTLRRPDGGTLPAWAPGAHIDLILAPELERQYSLCGDPDRTDHWRIGVLREPDGRGGSAFVHEEVNVGKSVVVRGPRNHFGLDEAPSYLFIAGGIGITPILPMIAEAHRRGAAWKLWFGGRRGGSMAFQDELAAHGDRVRFWPQEEKGLLPLDDILASRDADALVYCCGPEALLAAVESRSTEWPAGTLHLERFSPKEFAEPVSQKAFQVTCRQSGISVEVDPDRSILETLEEADVFVDSSCREGICGTCETEVISGAIEHRDSVLTLEEQAAGDRMMICVSRARGDGLVLDV